MQESAYVRWFDCVSLKQDYMALNSVFVIAADQRPNDRNLPPTTLDDMIADERGPELTESAHPDPTAYVFFMHCHCK